MQVQVWRCPGVQYRCAGMAVRAGLPACPVLPPSAMSAREREKKACPSPQSLQSFLVRNKAK